MASTAVFDRHRRGTRIRPYPGWAAAREPERVVHSLGASDRLLPVELDVTDAGQAGRAVEDALARFGRIDVLVDDAAYGLLGVVEEVSAAETASVLAVNLEGALTATRAALPVLRAHRSGRIVMMSSLGGSARTWRRGARPPRRPRSRPDR